MERSEKLFIAALALLGLLILYGHLATAGVTHPLFEVRDWQESRLREVGTSLENAG